MNINYNISVTLIPYSLDSSLINNGLIFNMYRNIIKGIATKLWGTFKTYKAFYICVFV